MHKATHTRRSRGAAKRRLGYFTASLMLATAMQPPASYSAHAQDNGATPPPPVVIAPQQRTSSSPQRDVGANGTPIVRIAAPNQNGVSHNSYESFNVDARGLILNNSRDIVTTQLAGFIDGNSNLANGEASLIINEVVGSTPTTLGGFIEIAGARAELVIANANGITCDGCGFINSGPVSLAAATPRFGEDGQLSGFGLGTGVLNVEGAGLDASNLRLRLFANAININAGVWADTIEAVAGNGEAELNGSEIIVTANAGADADQPRFALDVSALGGMFARSIRLIGTGEGLGVNVDGRLAAFDNGIELSADGSITVAGVITSESEAKLAAGDAIAVDGLIYTDRNLSLTADEVRANGLIASAADVAVEARNIAARGTVAAGLSRQGALTEQGNLSLVASDELEVSGRAIAGDSLALDAQAIELSGSAEGRTALVQAGSIDLAQSGSLRGSETLSLAAGTLTNFGLISGSEVDLETADTLTNSAGRIEGQSLSISAANLNNQAGLIQALTTLDINASELINNAGDLLALGSETLSLNVTGGLLSTGGTIGGNGAVEARVGTLSISGEDTRLIAGNVLSVEASNAVQIDGGGLVATSGQASLSVSGDLIISDGRLQAGEFSLESATTSLGADGLLIADTITAQQETLNNAGTILASGDAASQIEAQDLVNTGSISAAGSDFALRSDTLNNGGAITHAGSGSLLIEASDTLDNAGNIATNGQLTIEAAGLENSGNLTALDALSLQVAGSLENAGLVASGGDLIVSAQQILAMQNGDAPARFEASGLLNLTGQTIALGNSQVIATGDAGLSISAQQSLTATQARIGSNGLLSLTGDEIALGSSQITSLSDLSIDALGSDLTLGEGALIASEGRVSLNAAARLTGNGATISAGEIAVFSAQNLVLDDAIIEAEDFAFASSLLSLQNTRLRHTGTGDFVLTSAGTLDYSGAEIFSAGTNFSIQAMEIINEGGALLHAGDGVFSLTADVINNRGGQIATNGTLDLNAGTLENQGGAISAIGGGEISASASLENGLGANGQGGAISALGDLRVSVGSLDNETGLIEVEGALSIEASAIEGAGGRIQALGDAADLDLLVGDNAAALGLIISEGDIRLSGSSLSLNGDSRIAAEGALELTANSGALGVDAAILSAANVALNAETGSINIDNSAIVFASDAITISTLGLALSGGSTLEATNSLSLTADRFDNLAGTFQSLDELQLDAGELVNNGGTIFAGGNASISADNLSNTSDGNNEGLIVGGANAAITIGVSGVLDNRAGQIAGNGALNITAQRLINDGGSLTTLGASDITVSGLLDNGGGSIQSGSGLSVSATELRSAGLISGDDVSVSVAALLENAGQIEGQSLSLIATDIQNNGGLIQAAGDLSVSADDLGNSGSILALGDTALTLAITGDLISTGGTIGGNGDVNGVLGNLSLTGPDTRFVAANSLNLVINGTGEIASGATLAADNITNLTFAQDLLINGGVLQAAAASLSGNTLAIDAQGLLAVDQLNATLDLLENAGEVVLAGDIASQIDANAIVNSGSLAVASADFALETGRLDNSGEIAHSGTGTLSLTTNGAFSNDGEIGTNGSLSLTAPQLTNDGLITAVSSADIAVSGAFANNSNLLVGDELSIEAGSATLGNGSAMAARIEAGGALTFEAGGLTISNGELVVTGDDLLSLDIAGLLQSQNGLIGSNGTIAVGANSIAFDAGRIGSVGDAAVVSRIGEIALSNGSVVTSDANLFLTAATRLDASTSELGAAGQINLTASELILDDALIQGDALNLASNNISLVRATLRHAGSSDFSLSSTGTLDFSDAEIYSAGANFTIDAGTLINTGAALLHAGDGIFNITAGSIDNRSGNIATNGLLALGADTVDNRGGSISALGEAALTVAGTLDNSSENAGQAGLIASSAALSLSADTLNNRGGQVEGTGRLDLVADSLEGAGGQIASFGAGSVLDVTLTGTALGFGTLASEGDLALTTGTLSLGAGDFLSARQDATITALGSRVTIGLGATVLADQNLTITASELSIVESAIEAGSALTIDVESLTNTRGIIQSLGALDLTVDNALENNGGTIFAQGDGAIGAGGLINSAGGLIAAGSSGNLTINVSGAISNDGASIVSNNALSLSAASATNAGGVIGSLGNGTITIAGELDNTNGAIQSDASLALTASQIANTNGDIDALRSLSIAANALENGNGRILARGGTGINLTGNTTGLTLVNGAGGLVGSNIGLSVDAQNVTNSGVLFGNQLSLVTDRFDNLIGGSTSGDTVVLTAGLLNNASIISGDSLTISGNELNNLAGATIVGGNGILRVDVADITNRGTLAGGSGGLQLTATTLNNDGGGLGGSGATAIAAQTLINGNGTIAATGALSLSGASLSNGANGAIWSDSTGTFTFTNSITNAGTIGSQDDLRITTDQLNNASGNIASGAAFDIDFNSGTLGEVFSIGDVILSNAGNYALGAGESIVTLGEVNISATGNFTNAGTIESAGQVTLSAGSDFLNDASGSITATDLSISAGGTLTNDGLINGTNVALDANDILNRARIFGDVLSVTGRNSIENTGSDAVIASRSGLLGLYSDGTISNRDNALIFSLGSIEIGGAANNRAASLINSSARIEADGNIVINADTGLNERTTISVIENTFRVEVDTFVNPDQTPAPNKLFFSTTTEEITEDILDVDSGAGEIIAGGSVVITGNTFTNRFSNIIAGNDIFFSGATIPSTEDDLSGAFVNEALVGTRTTITEVGESRCLPSCNIAVETAFTVTRSDPVTTQIVVAPSIISAGGTVSIDAPNIANVTVSAGGDFAQEVNANLSNDPSLGNAVQGQGANSNNVDDATNVTGSGVNRLDVLQNGAFASGIAGNEIASLTAQDVLATVANVNGEAFSATSAGPDQSSVSGSAGSADATDAGTQEVDLLAGSGLGAQTLQGGNLSAVSASNLGFALAALSGQQSGPSAALMLNLSGLFSFAAPGSNFLVETDPAFTDFGNFLSSDFFLERLGFDPNRTQQRLGDALYEQRLIADQLTAQAGVARLDGYASAEDQYRALLDAGATYVEEFGLALGVGLSPEQMATLTSDIVILVEVEVETPEGIKKVLAPKLYLTQVNQRDLTTGGAVIAGENIQLRAANSLLNAGTIQAQNQAQISATDILNTGRLDLGQNGVVSAERDLINRAGTIAGGNVSLRAGRDISLESVATTTRIATQWDHGKRNYGSETGQTTTNRTGSVGVSGDLAVIAGRNLTISGTDVAAGGNIGLIGGESITVEAVQDSSDYATEGRRGRTRFDREESSVTNIGSSIAAGGDIGVLTPGELTVSGSSIAAAGDLSISAGSLDVEAVIDRQTLDETTIEKRSGLLSSTRTTVTTNIVEETALASTLEGTNVRIDVGEDARIAGSNIVADEQLAIVAGGDVSITSVETQEVYDVDTQVKKSGISIGSGGLFIGSAKTSVDSDTNSTRNNGSLVGSATGDVTIASEGSLAIVGSQVVTPGDITLSARDITIENATDVSESTVVRESSSFGLSIGVQSPILASGANLRDAANLAQNAGSDRVQAVAGAAGALAAVNTVDAADRLADAISNGGSSEIAITASIGISSSESEDNSRDETVIPSLVSGGDVTVLAAGAGEESTIDVTGSILEATNNLALAADGAITLESAQEIDTVSGTSSSSGVSLGVSVGLDVGNAQGSGPQVSASFNRSSSSYEGEDITNVETLLSAGGTASITTPDALTLEGAQVAANRVEIEAGSLDIISQQDTSTYTSDASSVGVSASFNPATGAGSVSGSFSDTDVDGDFASVQEQSGIFAGEGGFDINVDGQTNLEGGVIASGADAALNRLETGSLAISDIENREEFSASQLSLSGSLGTGGGVERSGDQTSNTDDKARSNSGGISTPLGDLNTGLPSAFSAGGSQEGTTRSAIAAGTLIVGGEDRSNDPTINRDTDGANDGALIREFTEDTRTTISQGFAAAGLLGAETQTFFANRAADEQELRDQADAAEKAGDTARHDELTQQANAIRDTFGAGSAFRIVATAINGAAGSDVSGSLTSLVQGSAVNVLQSLATSEVKGIADSLQRGGVETEESATVRAALQGLAGCVGGAAGGTGDCSSAAAGAAASVVLNTLLNNLGVPENEDLNGDGDFDDPGERLTLEEQQSRTDLVATLVGAIAAGAGLDAASAVTAAQIETENNQLLGVTLKECTNNGPNCVPQDEAVAAFLARPEVVDFAEEFGLSREELTRCLLGQENCDTLENDLRTQLVERAEQAGLDEATIAAIQTGSLDILVAARSEITERERHQLQIDALQNSDDPLARKLGERLADAPPEVQARALALAEGSGEDQSALTALGVAALESALSEDQIISIFLGNVREDLEREGVLPRTGLFDEAVAALQQGVDDRFADANADIEEGLAELRAGGASQAEIDAFIREKTREAEVNRLLDEAILGSVQFFGDLGADPAEVGAATAEALIRGFDEGVLRNETPVREYLERAGQSYEDYLNASPEEQGRIEAQALAAGAILGIETIGSKGLGRLAPDAPNPRRAGDGDVDAPETDPNNPPNGSANAPDTDSEAGSSSSEPIFDGTPTAHEAQLAREIADQGNDVFVRGENVPGPDARINGVWYDFKELTGPGKRALQRAINSAKENFSNNGAAGLGLSRSDTRAIIDVRRNSVWNNPAAIRAELDRMSRNGDLNNVLEVRVITTSGPITWRK